MDATKLSLMHQASSVARVGQAKRLGFRLVQTMLLMCFSVLGFAQTTLLSENMGTPTATTAIASNTFQSASPIAFSGTADVRNTTVSNNSGASGGGNIFFGTSGGNAKEFIISGINTSAHTSLSLSFGVLATTANNMLVVEYSADGTTYTALTVNATISANTWTAKTATGTIPSTSNLRIRFSKSSSVSFRLDDVKLTGTASSTPTLTAVTLASALSNTYGTAVNGVNFSAAGTNLTGNITVTPSSGYEVSTTSASASFSTSALSVASGSNNVWIRSVATKSVSTFNSTIVATLSGGGASSSVNITTSASGNQVTAKALTITGLTGNNKVYDGNATALVSGSASLSGVVGSDDVTISGTPSYNFANATVGSTKSITVTGYTLSGTASGNYSITQPSGLTGDITPASITITANGQTVTYGTLASVVTTAGSYVASGFVNSETASVISGSVSYTTNYTPTTDAATSGITITPVTSLLLASNYTFTVADGSITIQKANQSISFASSNTKIYGDAVYSAGATSATSAVNPITYSSSNTAVAEIVLGNIQLNGVGTTTITASQASSTNYNAASDVNQTLTVSAKELTITGLTAEDKGYDGNTTAAINGAAILNGVVGADDVQVVGTPVGEFASSNVGTSIPVSVSGLSLIGADIAKYTLTQPVLSADIIASTPTVLVSGTLLTLSTTYGSPSTSTSFSVSGQSLLEGITITPPAGFEVSSQADFLSNVGNNASPLVVGSAGSIGLTPIYVRLMANAKPVNSPFSGNVVLSSLNAVSVDIATVSSSVTPKSVTVSGLLADNKIFDSTATAFLSGTPVLNGIEGADVVSLAGTPQAEFSSVYVANGISVSVTGFSLTGSDAANYSLLTVSGLLANISKAGQTITALTSPVAFTYGDAPYLVATTATSGLTVSYSSSDPSVATVNGSGLVSIVGAGTCTITASQAGDANYNAAIDVTQTLTVDKANQTINPITASVSKSYGDAPYSAASTATSGLTVSYSSSDPSVATVNGSGLVSVVGVGTADITLLQSGDNNYNAASDVIQTLTVGQSAQTIIGLPLTDTRSISLGSYALLATAPGGTVTYTSSNPLVATISGNIVTLLSIGTTTITASQSGNVNYMAASDVQQVLTVAEQPSISFSPNSIATFNTGVNTASTAQAIQVSGSNLLSDLQINAPSAYEISKTSASSGFDTVQLVAPTLGIVSQTIYIRLKSNPVSGAYLGDLSASSTYATTVTYAVSGTVLANGAATNCVVIGNFTATPSGWLDSAITYATNEVNFAAQVGHQTTAALSNPLTLKFDLRRTGNATAKNMFVDVSTTSQTGPFTTVATFNHSNTTSGGTTKCNVDLSAYNSFSTVYVRFRKSSSTTSPWYIKNDTITCMSVTPFMSVGGGPLTAQTTNYGTASSGTSFTIGGTGLSSTISVAALSGFELATSVGGPYTASLSGLSSSVLTTVHVRLAAAAAVGTYSGNFVCTSGVNSINVPMPSSAVSKANQTITLASTESKTFGDANYNPGAIASSGLSVSYTSSDTSVAKIISGQIHIMSAGTVTITASQAGDGNYNAATDVAQTLTISKANQSISWTSSAAKTYGDASFTPNASSTTSGINSIYYTTSDSTIASIDLGQINLLAAGTVTITANQDGDLNYNASTPVQQIITIAPKNVNIIGLTADNRIYDSTTNATLSGTAILSGVINSDDVSLTGTPVATFVNVGPGTAISVSVTGYTLTGSKASSYSLQSLALSADITSLTPTIYSSGTLSNLSTTYGTASSATSFSITGQSMVDPISITPPAGYEVSTSSDFSANVGNAISPLFVGAAGSVSSTTIYVRLLADAKPVNSPFSGNVVLSSTGAVSVNVPTGIDTVNTKELSISGLTANNKTYDSTTSATVSGTEVLNGIVGTDTVSLSGTPAYNFVSANAGNNIGISVSGYSLTGSDALNYILNQLLSLTANIEKANQTIVPITSTNAVLYGDPAYSVATTSSAGLTVTYSTSDAAVVSVNASGMVLINGVGTATITASQSGDANYNPATDVMQEVTVGIANQSITFNPLANKTTSDPSFALTAIASSGLTVSYTSSDTNVAKVSGSTVTIFGVGTTQITASQLGNTNYNAALPVVQSLTVTLPACTPNAGTATWNFGTSAPGSALPSISGSNFVVDTFKNGNPVGPFATTLLSTTSPSSGYVGASASYNAANTVRVGGFSKDTSSYYEFKVTPTNGYKVSLTGMNFAYRATGTGPKRFRLRSNLDNYSSDIVTDTLSAATSTWALVTKTSLSASNPQANSPIIFRLYCFNGTGNPTSGSANMRVDDVVLNLSLSNEPSIATVSSSTLNSCSLSSSALPGLTPTTGIGKWSQVSGPGSTVFSDSTSASSIATVTQYGTYTYRWTVYSTTCSNSSYADVTATYNESPTYASVSTEPPLCYNTNGVILFSATGGNGTISYLVNGVTQTSPFATLAGTYTITASDVNACSITSIITLTQPDQLQVINSVTPGLCYGDNSSLSFSSIGGTAPITYLVDGMTTSPVSLSAGVYTVTATDINLCTATSVVNIVSTPAINLVADATSASCFGNSGSISFSATGGIGTITYTVNGSATASPYSSVAGTYTIVATDANSCSTQTVVTITEPSSVVLSANASNASCNGTNGSIAFSANGGTGAIVYTVNGSSTVSPYSAAAGTYTIIATDANSCSTQSVVRLSEPGALG